MQYNDFRVVRDLTKPSPNPTPLPKLFKLMISQSTTTRISLMGEIKPITNFLKGGN